jgi:hypothetical protein
VKGYVGVLEVVLELNPVALVVVASDAEVQS